MKTRMCVLPFVILAGLISAIICGSTNKNNRDMAAEDMTLMRTIEAQK